MMRELRFMLRERAIWAWLLLGFVLSGSAVSFGLIEVQQQRSEITELKRLDQHERELILSKQSTWGASAYYTFHLAYDPPSNFTFAALGQRDVSPWKHRIRMLALEGQIYETDTSNPDFALIGRFDFAFLISLIAPLLLIMLLFDLRSSERLAGRLSLIETSAANARNLWWLRSILRTLALATALCLPLFIGGLTSGATLSTLVLCIALVMLYLLFWMVVASALASANQSGSFNLTVLLGTWLLLCVVMPAALTQIIEKAIALPDGGEIVLTQREAVNDAWDLPRDATYTPFLERHPKWKDHTAWDNDKGFEWKWYYAFQQVGDQTVEPLSQAYQNGQVQRDQLASWLSLISPATLLQRKIESLAGTDIRAALEFEQSVRDFHAQLRAWYYPKLFQPQNTAQGYNAEEALASIPVFMPSK